MNIKMINKLVWLIVMLSLLTACLGIGSKKNDDTVHYYVIDVDRGAVAANFAKNRVLRIKPVKVTSHFRSKNIIFRVGENEYQPQKMNQLFSDPSEMITEQLKRWMQKTGLFSQVIIGDDQAADMVLEAAVTALYGEARKQFSPQSVLEMQFFLMDGNDETSKVMFQTGLRTDVDIDKTTSGNVVKGWKIGLEELLSTLEDDFSGYFSKLNP